jgi:hypothetical protein
MPLTVEDRHVNLHEIGSTPERWLWRRRLRSHGQSDGGDGEERGAVEAGHCGVERWRRHCIAVVLAGAPATPGAGHSSAFT